MKLNIEKDKLIIPANEFRNSTLNKFNEEYDFAKSLSSNSGILIPNYKHNCALYIECENFYPDNEKNYHLIGGKKTFLIQDSVGNYWRSETEDISDESSVLSFGHLLASYILTKHNSDNNK